MSDVTYERRKAVGLAWKNEKGLVTEGKGTRDWSQKEQKEIISKGKAKGYEGHHMKSVDGHNSRAGDPNNIQFLTRKEHLDAHKGNFRNNTNGYYDPSTGKMHDFGRSKASIEPKNLSKPLSESQKNAILPKNNASKKAEAAKAKARTTEARSVNKSKSSARRVSDSKTSTKSKTLSNQRSSKPSAGASTATGSKTLASQRSSTASSGKSVSGGRGASTGKGTSGGRSSASGGHSSGAGKGSGHGHGH